MKRLLSAILLFCYGLSIGHAMIPHCEDGDVFHSKVHEHEHEHHSDHDHSEAHFHHDNHHDHGIYDLLLCLLEDLDHHDHEANSSIHVWTDQLVILGLCCASFEFNTLEFKGQLEYGEAVIRKTNADSRDLPSTRGPPVLA